MPWLIVALALVSLGGPLVLLDRYDLASQYEDDAFYYFQIAKNVAQGHGFTFDGIHPTNGFHPLWLAALVPIFGVMPGLDWPVRSAGILEALLLGLAGAGVYGALRSRVGRLTAALAGLLLFALPGTRNMLRVGLESALSVFLLMCVWRASLRVGERGVRAWVAVGIACAFAALARLEAVVAIPCLIALERRRLRETPWSLVALGAPATLGVLAYVTWNQVSFGSLIPVSGLVKHFWSATESYALPLGLRLPKGAPSILLGSVMLLVSAAWVRRVKPGWVQPFTNAGAPLLVLVALSIVCVDVASVWYLARWYLGPAVLCGAVLAAVACRPSPTLSKLVCSLALVTAFARVPYTVAAVRSHRLQAHLRGEAADFLRQRFPAGTRIGSWNGGMLGYYSGQRLVMLDGLANSPAFYRRALAGADLAGYLRDEQIEWLATAGCTLGPILWTGRFDVLKRVEGLYRIVGPMSLSPGPDPCDSMVLWKRR